jgi:hypothetical protein
MKLGIDIGKGKGGVKKLPSYDNWEYSQNGNGLEPGNKKVVECCVHE